MKWTLSNIVAFHYFVTIAIFVPKLVAMVMPFCPLCMGVSQMNSLIAYTLSQNQTLHGYVAYNWSYGHFCEIFAYFGHFYLVAMATSLRPLQSEMSSFDWLTTKTPCYKSSHSHYLSWKCIYDNFCPKICCHGKDNKSSAVAEMGDRGHNRHGQKEGGSCVPFVDSWNHV